MINVWWDTRQRGTFLAAIQVEALDRTKLLRDVTVAISDVGVNILRSSTRAGRALPVELVSADKAVVERRPMRPAARMLLRQETELRARVLAVDAACGRGAGRSSPSIRTRGA